MGFFQSGFGKTLLGLGNAVTGGAVGQVYNAIDGAVKMVKGKGKEKKKVTGNSVDFRKSGDASSGTTNLVLRQSVADSSMRKMMQQAKENIPIHLKAWNWIKKNVAIAVGGVSFIGFGIIRMWQMAKPRSKRWGIFK